jgi:hypothetical protein
MENAFESARRNAGVRGSTREVCGHCRKAAKFDDATTTVYGYSFFVKAPLQKGMIANTMGVDLLEN